MRLLRTLCVPSPLRFFSPLDASLCGAEAATCHCNLLGVPRRKSGQHLLEMRRILFGPRANLGERSGSHAESMRFTTHQPWRYDHRWEWTTLRLGVLSLPRERDRDPSWDGVKLLRTNLDKTNHPPCLLGGWFDLVLFSSQPRLGPTCIGDYSPSCCSTSSQAAEIRSRSAGHLRNMHPDPL